MTPQQLEALPPHMRQRVERALMLSAAMVYQTRKLQADIAFCRACYGRETKA